MLTTTQPRGHCPQPWNLYTKYFNTWMNERRTDIEPKIIFTRKNYNGLKKMIILNDMILSFVNLISQLLHVKQL